MDTPQDGIVLPASQSEPATCAGPNCAVSPGSAIGVTPFKAYDCTRDYLDVIVVPSRKTWRAECNGVRRRWARAEVTDRECAALMVAADAFAEYLDRKVSCAEVKLEKETLWDYVASVAKSSPNSVSPTNSG